MHDQLPTHDGNNSEMVNEIIQRSQEIVERLQSMSDEEIDELYALIESVADELPEEVKYQLDYINTVRNQAEHEENFDFSTADMDRFNRTADSVMLVLNNIEQTPAQSVKVDIKNTASAEAARAQTTSVEVEKELFDSLRSKIMFLGFFPIAGIVQLIYLLLSAVFRQVWVVLLTLFYLCSIVLIIKSLHAPIDKNLLYFGAGLFILTHCCVTIVALKLPIFKKKIKLLWCIPGINMLYLPLRWAYDLQWGKVLLALCGLGCFATAVYMACQKNIEWTFLLVLASWIFSIVGNCIWGYKREK